jgi:hypothetical protein
MNGKFKCFSPALVYRGHTHVLYVEKIETICVSRRYARTRMFPIEHKKMGACGGYLHFVEIYAFLALMENQS